MPRFGVLPLLFLALGLTAQSPGAFAGCPAFTNLEDSLLEPPAEVTPKGNPEHYGEWVYQEFPFSGFPHVDSVAAWSVRIGQRSTVGTEENLVPAVEEAIYTTSEGKRIHVLGGLWPQQIIVPYALSPDVLADIWYDQPLISLTENEAALAPCGAVGPAIYPRNEGAAKRDNAEPGSLRSIYVKEIRDTDVAGAGYNGFGTDNPARPPIMQRGSELVIWGFIDSANYDNVISYHFRNDGTVVAMMGATGWNTPVGPPNRALSGNTPHVHTVLWRMRPTVGDAAADNSISVIRYDQHARLDGHRNENFLVDPVTFEAGIAYDASQLTRLLISDPSSFNDAAPGKPPQENAYVLTLLTEGVPRHRMPDGKRSSSPTYDFAVVRDRPEERSVQPFRNESTKTLNDILNGKSVVDQDVAIYVYSTFAHIPRAEDFIVHPGAPDYKERAPENMTMTMWSGIKLMPRNIYTRVPFSQPTPGAKAAPQSPLPLTRACAPPSATPEITELGCTDGRMRYRLKLSPINQNPFGRRATDIEIAGDDLAGSPLRVGTDLRYGEAGEIAPGQGLVITRPNTGQEACLSVTMSGDGWSCPAEPLCVELTDAACE